jgi:gliding motility-associated-like protein
VSTPDTSSLKWHWVFGNGNSSTIQNPGSQLYTTSGVFNIDLIATNSSGCIDTSSKKVEAYIVPTVDAGLDKTLCRGSSLSLNATGADNYQWSPTTGLNCSNCASPSTSTTVDITYKIKGTTIHGCSAGDSVKITVKNPLVMTYSQAASICKGDFKKLIATGAKSYIWTPSNGLDNPVSATPVVQPDTTTDYQVVGTDELGCFKDTGIVRVTVNQLPTVDAGLDKTINSGVPLDLIPTISADVSEVYWSPTNASTRNIYPGVTVKPVENTEYTVEVLNKKGCRAKDKVTVFVICNNGNVYVPNTFSPNDDGANDIFYPRGTGLFKVKSLRIFNRWGEKIFDNNSFDANDPSAGWNGTYKGEKLNSDVFVYILEIICSNKSVLTFKGNIALIK